MNAQLSRTDDTLKLSACIEWILQSECPDICDRIAAAAAAGPKDESLSLESEHQSMVEALKIAAPMVADAGITLLLEPVNTLVDHPGVFLDRTPEGLDVIEQVGHPAVRLLYDIYHSAAMGERPDDVLGNRVHLIHHVQAADLPGRHPPGTGAIAWREVREALLTRGYTGTIGLEYWPLGSGAESLRQARASLSA